MTTSSNSKLNFQHTAAEFAQAVQAAAVRHGYTPEKCLQIMAFDFERVILDRAKLKRFQERYVEGLNEQAGSVVYGLFGGVIKEVW
jgi:hypothetical protein